MTTRSTCDARRPSNTVDSKLRSPSVKRRGVSLRARSSPCASRSGNRGTTMVAAWPSERSALGSAADTSASPPTLTKGDSSVVTKVISIGCAEAGWARAQAPWPRPAARPCSMSLPPEPARGCAPGRPWPRWRTLAMTRLRAFDATSFRPAGVEDDAVVSVFRVPPEVAGQRVDLFVQSQLHRTSRTRAQTIVRASAYDASGRRLKPNDRVRAEQHILLWRPAWDETPVPLDIPVLYEDEHLMAVAKPALLPVHPTARYHKNTLIKLLQAARPDCAFLSLGHRLDRETSGVILISKTRACDRALKKQLADRDDIEKAYVAITWGVPDRGDGATTFRCEKSLELDAESPLRVKMRI